MSPRGGPQFITVLLQEFNWILSNSLILPPPFRRGYRKDKCGPERGQEGDRAPRADKGTFTRQPSGSRKGECRPRASQRGRGAWQTEAGTPGRGAEGRLAAAQGTMVTADWWSTLTPSQASDLIQSLPLECYRWGQTGPVPRVPTQSPPPLPSRGHSIAMLLTTVLVDRWGRAEVREAEAGAGPGPRPLIQARPPDCPSGKASAPQKPPAPNSLNALTELLKHRPLRQRLRMPLEVALGQRPSATAMAGR